MPTSTIIGTTEACQVLGVDRSTLVRWVQLGKVTPADKMPGASGAYLFRRRDIESLAKKLSAA